MDTKFDIGDEVRVTRNIRNDGTFPGRDTGDVLLRRGCSGFVRGVGTFLFDQIIYTVVFPEEGVTVGCRQEELIDSAAPWVNNRFEFRDNVELRCALSVKGEVVAAAGSVGEVQKVVGAGAPAPKYHVYVDGRTFLVPEASLASAGHGACSVSE